MKPIHLIPLANGGGAPGLDGAAAGGVLRLPPSESLLRERLFKEATHELGHTFGLRHCMDWRCVMASSHGVERLDVKTAEFCVSCRRPIAAGSYW